MKTLFSALQTAIQQQQDCMLVTVIAGSGSTPRGAGAKMAVFADGTITGTIGGGALEYKAQQMAQDALQQHKSYTWEFKLHPNQVADLGMVCGGDVEVYFQYLNSAAAQTADLLEQILQALNKNADSWLITGIAEGQHWAQQTQIADKKLLSQMGFPAPLTNKTAIVTYQEQKYYAEPLQTAGRVYIFGGGHISKSLVPVLYPLGFRTVVVDDKAEFADPARFPLAEQTIQTQFTDYSDAVPIDESDYVVIMTRGHANDYDVLVQALRTKACYIGMIGSRSKLKTTREKLLADGFSDEDFNRVHAPIGLAIKAVTPEEIAISIAAQLIMERAQLT